MTPAGSRSYLKGRLHLLSLEDVTILGVLSDDGASLLAGCIKEYWVFGHCVGRIGYGAKEKDWPLNTAVRSRGWDSLS